MATDDGRTYVQYRDEDGGDVSLPGYLDARPSIVSPGDTFSIREEYAGEVLASDRFVEASAPSSSDSRTKAELAEIVGVNPDDYTKGELESLVADRERMYPPVPGATGDNAGDPDAVEAPIPGQQVAGGLDSDDDVPTTDDTEGGSL